MAIGQKAFLDPHRRLRKGTDRHRTGTGQRAEKGRGVSMITGQLPSRLADIGQPGGAHRNPADDTVLMPEIADPVHPASPERGGDSRAVRPAQPQHRQITGDIGDAEIGIMRDVSADVGQVALQRRGADHQPEMVLRQTEDCQVAFDAASLVQHQCVAGGADRTVNPVGADRLKAGQRIWTANIDLAKARDLGDPGSLMRCRHLGADMLEPVGAPEGQNRLGRLVEIEGPFDAEDLTKMCAMRHPRIMKRQGAKVACRCPLPSRIGDLVMFAKHLGDPGRQCRCAVHRSIKPFRIGLVKVGWRCAMLDGVGQRHAGPATGGHTDRIHPASKKQPARLRCLTKKEAAVGRETLRPVQQHLHLGMFQAGKPVKRVVHHRFEMIPILGKKLKGKVAADPVWIDRLSHRLETADKNAAGIIADIEVAVMVGQGRQIAFGPRHRPCQKIEMLAGPDRHLGAGHRRGFTAPQAGAQRDRIAFHRTAVGLDAGDPVAFGQNSGHAGILENACPGGPRTLDQRRAEIRRADAPIIR